jgi:presenilin-like A22 family membrane protease
MEQTSPRLTGKTTMWKAWVGFNASHSTGAMFFGFILCFAALLNLHLYAGSQIIQAVTLANTLFYLWLARKYWFRIPFAGILLSGLLQIAALLVIYRIIQFSAP